MSTPTHFRENPKQAAIDQWTADPCGPCVTGEPGTRAYFEGLLVGRQEYAPWMADVLDYEGASGVRVLDVGCGQGIDVARYAIAGAVATGVDLTPRHVELAKAHVAAMGLNAAIQQGDVESLPFPDASFERVSCNGVLHHTPDMPAGLREIHRVLTTGGEARIIVYNRSSAWFWLTLVLGHGIGRGLLLKERGDIGGVASREVEHSTVAARPLVRFYTRHQLCSMLSTAGFRDVRAEVRHFIPDHGRLLTRWIHDQRLIRWLDRRVGFYVIGYGSS